MKDILNRSERRLAEKLIKSGDIIAFKNQQTGETYFTAKGTSKKDVASVLLDPISLQIERDLSTRKNSLL